MKRLQGGYSAYFNIKYKRSGSLFQGPYRASHITTNEYLLHVSAYVNLNNRVHQLSDRVAQLVRSSWDEYVSGRTGLGLCKKDIVLGQFKNPKEYKKFALSSLYDIAERKEEEKELEAILLTY